MCGNPKCSKTFYRKPNDIPPSGICYCSRSCSAVINNPKSAKRRKRARTCPNCGIAFIGRRKYCSNKCFPKRLIFPKNEILREIKFFFKENGRIPFRNEFFHAKAARFRFGTWNKAIEAAGFEPNPVKFAKKYIANDKHKCDSLAEKIIDDWLFAKKIPHQKNAPYFYEKFTADFKVNEIYIEFFGLQGELKAYDRLLERKLKFIKDKNLKLIAIFPKDIFPVLKLDYVLKDLRQH